MDDAEQRNTNPQVGGASPASRGAEGVLTLVPAISLTV